MNIVLWIIQGLAALAFLISGFLITFQPIDIVAKTMAFAKSFPPTFVRFIGIAELLGGIGLILPALTHILPWLTGAAAVGLVIIMIGAIGFHISRREYSAIAPSVILLLLAAFIVYGRWILLPL